MEDRDRNWEGTPLDMAQTGIDAYGLKEIAIEFGEGQEEILRPRSREEFGSYELQQAAVYIKALSSHIRAARLG